MMILIIIPPKCKFLHLRIDVGWRELISEL